VTAPAAVTLVAPTSVSVSGTGDDATINANFSAIDSALGDAVIDLNNLRNRIIDNQTILTNLVNKVNSLLVELRAGTGVAILASL